MTWSAGDIATSGTTTQITNSGTFNINLASDATLGTAGNGAFTNATGLPAGGTLNKLGTATSTVAIPFLNLGGFAIQTGTAKFTSTEVQGKSTSKTSPIPSTTMSGGSLDTGTGTYVVYDGVFQGGGTVTGNLAFNGGDLTLGLDSVPLGLTVVGSFVQSAGTFNVYINTGGTCSNLNASTVNLTGGTLSVHNKPYTGTGGFTFMTSGAAIVGNFTSVAYETMSWGTPARHFVPGFSADGKSYNLANQLV